jgi:F-type H+-transporting ATPase subunit b
MNRSRVLFAVTSSLVAALPVRAAEGGESGGVFAGDIGNALWTVVIFGFVVFILGRFAWKPVLSGLQAREAFIRESLEQARNDREEAEYRLEEYNDRLDAARNEATAIVEESRHHADAVRQRIEEEAQAEANRGVQRARREIELAKESAVKELYASAARLTAEVAGRILDREIDPDDHERLIRQAIDRLAGDSAGDSEN